MRRLLRSSPALVALLATLPGLMLATTALPLGVSGTGRAPAPDTLPFTRSVPAGIDVSPLREEFLGLLASGGELPEPPPVPTSLAAQLRAVLPELTRFTYIRPLVNDAFAAAYSIPSLPFSGVTRTRDAGRDTAEPADCSTAGTVWFSYRAPSDEPVVVSTYGSDYTPKVGVYTSVQGAALAQVGSCVTRLATVSLAKGRDYFFQVSGGDARHNRLVFHLVRSPGQGSVDVISRSRTGRPASWGSGNPQISRDGRYLTFISADHDLSDTDPTANEAVLASDAANGCPPHVPLTREDNLRPCSIGMYQIDLLTRKVLPVGDGYGMEASSDGSAVVFIVGRAKGLPETVHEWNRATGKITPVVTTPDGHEARGFAVSPVISANGRYVAFPSNAADAVPSQELTHVQVLIRDRQTGKITRISTPQGKEPDDQTEPECMSADGRYVVVVTKAGNIDPGDSDGDNEVYRVDTRSWEWRKVSVNRFRGDANGPSGYLQYVSGQCISDDGRYVAFASAASDLVPNDGNNGVDVFVRDVQADQTDRVSVASDGSEAHATQRTGYQTTPAGDVCTNTVTLDSCDDFSQLTFGISLSGDGRYVAFGSQAADLTSANDTNSTWDIFRHDRLTGQTILISRGEDGNPDTASDSYGPPVMARGGEEVLFTSNSPNLAKENAAGAAEIYAWRAS